MSALGHEQTSRHVCVMSVIPLKADMHQHGLHVRARAMERSCHHLLQQSFDLGSKRCGSVADHFMSDLELADITSTVDWSVRGTVSRHQIVPIETRP
jgi:hypothetical protein